MAVFPQNQTYLQSEKLHRLRTNREYTIKKMNRKAEGNRKKKKKKKKKKTVKN
jgi:hypothetical protein